MTDLERRALLGDKQAQEECTRQGIVLPCPHCRGNAKVSFKDARFIGQNDIGDKKLVYRVQVICNKCRSRGKPIFTEPLINPNPYLTKLGNCYHAESEVCAEVTNRFLPYVLEAVSEWNTRPAPPIGRCASCACWDENTCACESDADIEVAYHKYTDPNFFCGYYEQKGGEENG